MGKVISCSSCGAPLLYDSVTPQRCSFCGSRLIFDKNTPLDTSVSQATGTLPKKNNLLVVLGAVVTMVVLGIAGAVFLLVSSDPVLSEISTAPPEIKWAGEELRVGGEGTGVGRFTDNRVVAVDAENRVYSADYSGNRVQIFDAQGKFITQWTHDLTYVQNFKVSRSGKLYMSAGSQIVKFDGMTGEILAKMDAYFTKAIAIKPNGDLISCTSTGDILEIDENLHIKSEKKDALKSAGMDNFIVSAITCNGLGELFMLDFTGQNVFHYSAKYEFVDRFKTKGFPCYDIAVNPKDQIFVSALNDVYIHQNDGDLLGSFPVKQTFGMAFSEDGFLWTASRPYLVKYKINEAQ
jgi:DNA-directed RNA polymerase subunit RPC12/RpoP